MMPKPGRILVVDDLERWRDDLSETLESGGFEVDTAATIEEAVDRLATRLYHLLLLDIRMQDADLDNQEGMQLLRDFGRQGVNDAPRVIILSAYGTTSQMREAFSQYGVVDFLDKQDFTLLELLERVQQLFREDMKINLGLAIHWQGGANARQAVHNLGLDGTRVKRDTPLQSLLAEELEDLLCRLFHNANSVLVRPLGTGKSGAHVLWVQPFYSAGGARPVAIKFGDFRQIDQEFRNFSEFVQPYVGGGRSTAVLGLRRTPRLGGIVYSLLGEIGETERLEDFATFYRRESVDEICRALDRLFLDTCATWYANPGQLHLVDLTRQYSEWLSVTAEVLNTALAERLRSVHGKDKLFFQSLPGDRSFRNPILAYASQNVVVPTYETITHGDFNGQNILLDSQGNSWLIDFQRTGPGHYLRDVIQLDMTIRLRLIEPEEATLAERCGFEEALLGAESHSQEAGREEAWKGNPALRKAYAICLHLRGLVDRLVANHPSGDMTEYHAGLMVCALNTIRSFFVPSIQREHALLSASLLAGRLRL